jgi:hypothetical protein
MADPCLFERDANGPVTVDDREPSCVWTLAMRRFFECAEAGRIDRDQAHEIDDDRTVGVLHVDELAFEDQDG